MEKREILEKAKKENKYGDELYKQVHMQGSKLGMAVGILICGIMALVDVIIHSEMTLMSIPAMLIEMAMQCTMYTVLAVKCKKRGDIIMACLFGVLVIGLIAFLIVRLVTA